MSETVFRPKPESPFRMTAEQVADWFVNLHVLWFTTPGNDLYGELFAAKAALVLYLKTSNVPHGWHPLSYVVTKFREEAESWFTRETRPG